MLIACVSVQLTPLQFFYSLQTESQRAAAAAAAAAAMATAVGRSTPLSSCQQGGDVHASRRHVASHSRWKRPRRHSLVSVDSKIAKTDRDETASSKLHRRKQASSKTGRHSLAVRGPRGRDTALENSKDKSGSGADGGELARRNDEQKCDGRRVGDDGETEEQAVAGAATEKRCCQSEGIENKSCSAAATAVQSDQDPTASPECRRADDDDVKLSPSKSQPASSSTSTSPAVAVSKLKIFKCSESKKLCVRSADTPLEQSPASAAVSGTVPKLCMSKNLVVRRSGTPAVDAHSDDKRERHRRRRRRRRDEAKTVVDCKTIVDRTTSITELDSSALSPGPPDLAEMVATTEQRETVDPVGKQQVLSAASSPLSSSDNVVSSSTSSRLLADDDDDDDVISAERRIGSKPRSRRTTPGDVEDAEDDGKPPAPVDQAGGGVAQDDPGGGSATTLRVPIRLGGQSGQTGELLLRLPQNVSVQCSFGPDQILIASSPATTGVSEQSTVSAGAAGVAQSANTDTELTASQQHVSNAYLANK